MAAGFVVSLPCFALLALDVRAVPVEVVSCLLGLAGAAVGTALWPAVSIGLADDIAGSEAGGGSQ